MNIFGCLFIWAFAWMFRTFAKGYRFEEKDYSGYPVTEGVVIGTHDYIGERWMVRFTDPEGNEVIGADDFFSKGTFHPERYSLPKRGENAKFYFWKHNKKNFRLTINNTPCLYYIHFCNPAFYELTREAYARSRRIFQGISFVLFLLGIAVLIWGC